MDSTDSRQDVTVVRRLEILLRTAGAEVWVDHVGIRGGDNLPKRISDALEWCNTLLLMWSDSARRSKWVEKEWTNADALDRTIIPCLLDRVSLPGILASKVYVDFRDFEKGIAELLNTLELAPPQATSVPIDIPAPAPAPPHGQLKEETIPSKPNLPKPSPTVLFRSKPLSTFSVDEVKNMLLGKDFFAINIKDGKGLRHQYESTEQLGEKLVIDHTTGLMWQQSGSQEYMNYWKAENYIRDLNDKRFAGYTDWRLPTLEEAMSLMESKKHADLYIDPVFDRKQTWIWTADKYSADAAWVVGFGIGYCYSYDVFIYSFVRAVRGGQSNI